MWTYGQTGRPESHLNGQNLDEVVNSKYIRFIWVIRILNPDHRGNLFDHNSLLPHSVVLIKFYTVLFEACIQLWGHDGPLQYLSFMVRINQVSIPFDPESYERDAHSVLVEEDVRMGAV